MEHEISLLIITLSFQLVSLILQLILRKYGHGDIVSNVAKNVQTAMQDHKDEIQTLKKSIEPLIDEQTLLSLKSLATKIFTVSSIQNNSNSNEASKEVAQKIDDKIIE